MSAPDDELTPIRTPAPGVYVTAPVSGSVICTELHNELSKTTRSEPGPPVYSSPVIDTLPVDADAKNVRFPELSYASNPDVDMSVRAPDAAERIVAPVITLPSIASAVSVPAPIVFAIIRIPSSSPTVALPKSTVENT